MVLLLARRAVPTDEAGDAVAEHLGEEERMGGSQ